jgi:hypothetical protein
LPVDPNFELVDLYGCPIWPACDDPWRPSPAGDIDVDCYVAEGDVIAMGSQWLQCTNPLDAGCVQLQPSPEELYPDLMYMPHGEVSVDGNITTDPAWADPCWIALDLVYTGDPCDIVSARYAVCWGGPVGDPDSMIYAAVEVVDNDQHLSTAVTWNDSDRIEVYIQGDPNGGSDWGTDDSQFFDKAQQFAMGKQSSFGTFDWIRYGDGSLPLTGGQQDSVGILGETRRSGSTLTYEVGAKAWQYYGGENGNPSIDPQLEPGLHVGFDIIATTVYGATPTDDSDGEYGMLSANLDPQKFKHAERFQRWELLDYDGTIVPPECGDWGILASDIYRDADCHVGLPDFAVISNEWMECTDPCAPCGYDPF